MIMIRPLKLIYNAKTYDENGRYTTTSKYSVNNHRDEILNNKILVPEDSEFWKKLLSHPITAFGYDIQFRNEISNLPNPRFSKHDIIRSLDFWIEHWVYQNQVESVLTGTVNVDHEITLKELILVREKIMKMSVDTKFTRERIKEPVLDYSKGGHNFNFEITKNNIRKFYHYDGDDDRVITNMTKAEIKTVEKEKGYEFPIKGYHKKPKLPEKVVFTQAVYCEDSSLDPFCHMVLELTPEEYTKYKNKPYTMGQIEYDFRENFRGNNRFAFIGIDIAGAFTNTISSAMNDAQRSMTDLVTALNDINISTPGGDWTTLPSQITSNTRGPDHLLTSGLHPGIPKEEEE